MTHARTYSGTLIQEPSLREQEHGRLARRAAISFPRHIPCRSTSPRSAGISTDISQSLSIYPHPFPHGPQTAII